MLVQDLATILIREHGESQDDTDYVDTVVDWISEACSEIADRTEWRFFKATLTPPIVALTAEYDLGPLVKEVKSVRHIDTNEPIRYTDDERIINRAIDIDLPGVPRHWWYNRAEEGSFFIAFYPIPDRVYQIEVRAFTHPTALIISDNIPLHTELLRLVKDRVRAFMLNHDKDYDGSDRALNVFMSDLNRISNREVRKHANHLRLQPRDIGRRTRDLAVLDPNHFHWYW